MISSSIFKAYDIRGIVGRTLDADTAQRIGRAFGSEARARGGDAVAVARDGRLSGPELAGALTRASARRAWTYLIWARFQRLWRILQRTSRWKAAASIRATWSLAATIRLNTMASKWCCAARRCTVNASRHCASGLNRKISAPGGEVIFNMILLMRISSASGAISGSRVR